MIIFSARVKLYNIGNVHGVHMVIISVVTTNQYNDDIGMPPTKKSRTRSPPNITEGESVMIASLLCIFFRITVQTLHHSNVTHSQHLSVPVSRGETIL